MPLTLLSNQFLRLKSHKYSVVKSEIMLKGFTSFLQGEGCIPFYLILRLPKRFYKIMTLVTTIKNCYFFSQINYIQKNVGYLYSVVEFIYSYIYYRGYG